MAFIDYTQELVGVIPQLSSLYAGTLVNRAYKEIRDKRLWTWLRAEAELVAPPPISDGYAAVTQFGTTVTFDSTAGPLVLAVVDGVPPLLLRQFRLAEGPMYNILAYTTGPPVTITLDRPFGELTTTGSSYSIYRCYFTPPQNDFLKFWSLLNACQGYTISGERLGLTREELDRRDPQRQSQGDAHYIASYKAQTPTYPAGGTTPGAFIWELWEHPTNPATYIVNYQRRGVDMVLPTDDIPSTLMSSVLMPNALAMGCMWAASNVGRHKELKGVNWMALAKQYKAEYILQLHKAQHVDDELSLQYWIDPEDQYRLSGPIDGRYLQSHDLTFF
jgi:hypothetical protein